MKEEWGSQSCTSSCTIMERNKRMGESFNYTFRVCLFGGKIGWMENFGKKMGRETVLECVWLGGEDKTKWWDPCVFSPDPPKSSLQNWEKTEERNWISFLDENAHVQLYFHLRCFFSHFFFFLFFLRYLPFFFLIFLWIWFLFFNKFRWLIFFGCLSFFRF